MVASKLVTYIKMPFLKLITVIINITTIREMSKLENSTWRLQDCNNVKAAIIGVKSLLSSRRQWQTLLKRSLLLTRAVSRLAAAGRVTSEVNQPRNIHRQRLYTNKPE